MRKIRIGSGAGYAGDRIEPAVELIRQGEIDYICFECLAERTIAIAQQAKQKNPNLGYNPLLEKRMEAILPLCHENETKVISNMGAANPIAALEKTVEVARAKNIRRVKMAAIAGDDVLEHICNGHYDILESEICFSDIKNKIVSANAYLGHEAIVEALRNDAQVILTGRVADPSLFLAPLVYEFGWRPDAWDLLGKGTAVGHLLECAGQITGGYYADPHKKDIEGLDRLGFPIAEVVEDGSFLVTKTAESGGEVTRHTCIEQILYEVHDPANYYTPDVIADYSKIDFAQTGKNRVSVSGVRGKPCTDSYKVSIGYVDSYIGQGEISYAGSNCTERAKLALEIIKKRLERLGMGSHEARYDIIGVNSIYEPQTNGGPSPHEVRCRVAVRCGNASEANVIGDEVEALYTNGPAGGGGASKNTREVIGIVSTLIPKSLVKTKIKYITT